jgi:hypothetical protein
MHMVLIPGFLPIRGPVRGAVGVAFQNLLFSPLMAILPEDPIQHANESVETPVSIFYQEATTDIEHTIVKDDPRKWGNARKVS